MVFGQNLTLAKIIPGNSTSQGEQNGSNFRFVAPSSEELWAQKNKHSIIVLMPPPQGELRICVLPSHLSYDSAWPVRKVPTRCSTHYVTYHMESKVGAVQPRPSHSCCCCRLMRWSPVSRSQSPRHPWGTTLRICSQLRGVGGCVTSHTVSFPPPGERFIPPMEDRFYLQLFSPTSWEPVPNSK